MASEYTPNYNLDLYASEDKPNLRDQYNAAMGKIDTQLKANADGVTNVSASVVAATTAANEAKQIAQDAETAADAAAPISHASENSTYGLGTLQVYGHVALASTIGTPSIMEDGVAASPRAVYQALSPIESGLNNLKSSLNGITYQDQEELSYIGNVSGNYYASSHYTPGCDVCCVQYNNISMTVPANYTGFTELLTLPNNLRPLSSCWQTMKYDKNGLQLSLVVTWDGKVRLGVTNAGEGISIGGNIGATIMFICEPERS